MSKLRLFAALTAVIAFPFAAFAQIGVFEPARLKPDLPGGRTELAVLGTPHLSGWPKDFDARALDGLLDRLAAWHPDVIAIEALSGMQCDALARYPDRYKDTVESYCGDTSAARVATGLDIPAATQQAERMLADWPDQPSPAQRRRLAALFLAGGEPASALVQWLRLAEGERHEGEGIDGALVARLARLQASHNESYLIASRLAARLGHERVHAMDDHSSDKPLLDEEGFAASVMKAWDNPATARRRATDAALMGGIGTSEGVLALYRTLNAPDQAKLVFDSDFGAALVEPSAKMFGRNYAAGWETRNLRMAANIREAMAEVPGGRALVIVGASHKFYLQAYLDAMHDVKLADVEALLR